MAKFIVDFWMDGYDSEEEMVEAAPKAIEELLDSSGTSVKVKLDNSEELLSDLESLDTVGVYWDYNWQQIRETSRHPEYIRIKDLDNLIKKYRGG